MQRVIPIESVFFVKEDEVADSSSWKDIFGNSNPLAFEIGCGVGDFIVNIASRNMARNHIAIDIYNKGCLKTCKRIEKNELTNVRVLRSEARKLLEEKIAPDSLEAVYINCPDPWPKKKHRKRRLVNRQFVEFLWSRLKAGGDFFFATDFTDYGLDVAAFMQDLTGFENVLSPDPYRHQLEDYHLTKYMLKFMEQGSRVYFIHYRKEMR